MRDLVTLATVSQQPRAHDVGPSAGRLADGMVFDAAVSLYNIWQWLVASATMASPPAMCALARGAGARCGRANSFGGLACMGLARAAERQRCAASKAWCCSSYRLRAALKVSTSRTTGALVAAGGLRHVSSQPYSDRSRLKCALTGMAHYPMETLGRLPVPAAIQAFHREASNPANVSVQPGAQTGAVAALLT